MKIWMIWSQNAGKSTLFNRLIGTYRAIITDIAGTTRDIISHEAIMDGIWPITVMDSPGLDNHENELPYIERIITESDAIIMMVDSRIGMNSKDEEMISMVRRQGKMSQMILFLNKMDKIPHEDALALLLSEYAHLWVEHIAYGSAHHGKTGELMRILHAMLGDPEDDNDEEEFDEDGVLIEYDDEDSPTIYEFEDEDEEFDDEDILLLDDVKPAIVQAGTIPIAIIGRPNVGKSTFINQVSNKELSKVSAIPGTTLDYISSEISVKEQDYVLYDTAGIRRKGSIHGLEKIAFEKTYGMLKYYQPIVLFLISGDEGVTKTDRALMSHILDLHIPILVVINKIDTLNNLQKEKLLKAVEEHFGHKDRLFTIGISAKTGFNINKIRPIVNDLRARSHVALTTGQLNKTISRAFIAKPPTFPHNKIVKVYYTTQVKSYPPIFMCFINKKPNVTKAFNNWLDSVVRKAGGWQGIPLHFLFKDKKMDEDGYAKHLEKRKQAIRARLKRTPKEKIEAKQKAIARATQKRGM